MRKNIIDFQAYTQKMAEYLNSTQDREKVFEAGLNDFFHNANLHVEVISNAKDMLKQISANVDKEMQTVIGEGVIQADAWLIQVEDQTKSWRAAIQRAKK